ncbi:hypothetical protein AB3Z07_07665 [Metabacillus halosaccharovorans]|nr:hypothetical protein [Metabacillus halosaccharovorans]MCM3443909.1 hypothetical protein [Metabacillus halosaccharovorans]
MNQKPLHYDGSSSSEFISTNETTVNQVFEITDEMRKNIAGNPYVININD